MRLKQAEVLVIIEAVNKFAKGKKFELFLYGSRVDDTKLGGDIDLLLVAEDDTYFRKHLYLILSEIKKRIGEQKIDVAIVNENAADKDEFIKHIYPKAIRLL